MVVGSGWTSPSQKDLTPRPLESTWADPHTVEVAPVVLAVIHATTTVDMSAGMTEAATIAMMTGTTTDHTEGDLLHRTTEGLTGLAPGHGLTLPAAIEHCCRAPPPLPKHRQEMFYDRFQNRCSLFCLLMYMSSKRIPRSSVT